MSARATRLRFQALGLVMVLGIASFFALTILMYRKAFTPEVSVTAVVDKVGSQLQQGATVKARGVEVGEVSGITASGTGATLHLRLDPGLAAQLPSTVSAAMLPKTLFGDRYVSLNIPKGSAAPLRNGDVIHQDRSASTVAIQDVLDDLVPVLKAVPPAKVASTLSAISTALQGKGEELGQTVTTLGSYLGKMNPEIPQLSKDIQRFAEVTPNFVDAVPRLIDSMSNFATTARTLTEQQKNLQYLYGSVIDTSADLNKFLLVNKENLVSFVGTAKPVLKLLERYSPEYPCLFDQFAKQVDTENKVFGKGNKERPHAANLRITLSASRGQYKPGTDDPKNLDDRGPRCYTDDGKTRFPQFPDGKPLQDGTKTPPAPNMPQKASEQKLDPVPGGTSTQSASQAPSIANSRAEQRLLSGLLSQQLNTSPDKVPGWAGMLVGPLYRGSAVELR
ncbi:MCE family protein [Sciscionella marina]|uniref:MCE family protein n=1 Tax=Sciscionella marina TaxID=508770 RepID=UPI000371762C|nr:MCE family protein [Sciscionella marina]